MADGLCNDENTTGGDVDDVISGERVTNTGRPIGNDAMPSVADASPYLAELWNAPKVERSERLFPNVLTTDSDVADRVSGGSYARSRVHEGDPPSVAYFSHSLSERCSSATGRLVEIPPPRRYNTNGALKDIVSRESSLDTGPRLDTIICLLLGLYRPL